MFNFLFNCWISEHKGKFKSMCVLYFIEGRLVSTLCQIVMKNGHFNVQISIFSKASNMGTMAFFKLFYMVISKIKMHQNCLSYGTKIGIKNGKFPNFHGKLDFFTYKFKFFWKLQSCLLLVFLSPFTWKYQNSRFPNCFWVIGQKPAKKRKIFTFLWINRFFCLQIFFFSKTSTIILIAFFELFHMQFSEFKNSIYFKSYAQKTTENGRNFTLCKNCNHFRSF